MLDLRTRPPTLIRTGDGTRLGMQSTVLSPRAGEPPLSPPLNPLIAPRPVLPRSSNPTIPTIHGVLHPPNTHWTSRKYSHIHGSSEELVSEPSSPTDDITTHSTSIPSSTNVPHPHCRSLCSSTIWGPYLIKHGGYAKDLKSLDPTHKVKKPAPISANPGAEVRGRHQSADTDTDGRTETDKEDVTSVREAWTPPPEGYHYNLGDFYVPMHIKGPDGRLWPAKFTKVEYTDNPRVCGYRAGSPTPYSDYLYAEPYFDLYRRPRYSKADLWFLSHCYPYRDEVDLGFHTLNDYTVKAEVRHYRGLEAKLIQLTL
jgi:hypothetical protein